MPHLSTMVTFGILKLAILWIMITLTTPIAKFTRPSFTLTVSGSITRILRLSYLMIAVDAVYTLF